MKDRNPEAELRRLLDFAADSVTDMTDDDISEALMASGVNPTDVANKVDEAFARGIAAHKKKLEQEFERLHDEELTRMRQKTANVPPTSEKRRSLLEWILGQHPDFGPITGLTYQNRNYSNLPDEDVQKILERMAKLGLLDDQKEQEDKK